jgi:SWI/SNF-related matrix-associated actin-dependent regulator 1 of chromatin subfamily A
MAVRFFPARYGANCALCGNPYAALDMVGFYPGSQISHADCALYPNRVVTTAAPPLRVIKSENLDAFKVRIMSRINPGMEPMPFQVEGAYQIEKFGSLALLADEQGLGKTIQALIWLAVHRKVRPAVIVVPQSVKLNWRREAKKWLPRKLRNRVYILNGRKPVALPETGIFVINYDIVKFWLAQLRAINPQVVICDESQYLKNPNAQRTRAVLGTARSKKSSLCENVANRIFLSGTPAENRPSELWPVLHNLRPDAFPRFVDFAHRYCAAYEGKWGLNVSGASNIAELAGKLRKTCMIRRLKADVLPDLPPKRRATIPFEITNRKEYEFAKDDLIAWMKSVGQDVTGALRAETLVRIEKLKQIAARGKMDAACEWIHNFLAGGKKLVLYVHHREIGSQLLSELKQYNPVTVFGENDSHVRQANIDTFQNNADCRVIICSIRAARLGITLTAASDVAFFELDWTPGAHDQAEDRVHRIGQADACTAYYLLADRTIEQKIAALIDAKRGVIAGLIDQREVSKSEDILGSLVTELAA